MKWVQDLRFGFKPIKTNQNLRSTRAQDQPEPQVSRASGCPCEGSLETSAFGTSWSLHHCCRGISPQPAQGHSHAGGSPGIRTYGALKGIRIFQRHPTKQCSLNHTVLLIPAVPATSLSLFGVSIWALRFLSWPDR